LALSGAKVLMFHKQMAGARRQTMRRLL